MRKCEWVGFQNTQLDFIIAETRIHLFQSWFSPVLFLPIKVGYNVQKAANEGLGSYWAGGALARGLSGKHGTAPLCVGQLLLHLHILLPEQGQVLLQLGHLLCSALWWRRERQRTKIKIPSRWDIKFHCHRNIGPYSHGIHTTRRKYCKKSKKHQPHKFTQY